MSNFGIDRFDEFDVLNSSVLKDIINGNDDDFYDDDEESNNLDFEYDDKD